MPLQTENLVMVGLGVLRDTPPNSLQPALQDGIHLRWSYALGFPWYGFYLFRRKHHIVDPTPVLVGVGNENPGMLPDTTLETNDGRFSSNTNLVLTTDFARPGSLAIDLSNRDYVRFSLPPGVRARQVRVEIGFRADVEIQLMGLSDNVPVAHASVRLRGLPGQVVLSPPLEFDQISAIEISAGPAVLVTLTLVLVSTGANIGWEPVPDFPYPMCLPLTQPDYPCTQGVPENLAQARAEAELRINRFQYGDPNQFTPTPAPIYTAGVVSVFKGSPIVEGSGTDWTEDLVGATLQVDGEPTAYTIVMVVDAAKLVLSRDYGGSSKTRATYTINEDPFGQLHDTLVHLVIGGIAAGGIGSRSLPMPATTLGTIKVARGSTTIIGTGTNWSANLAGLALQVAREASGTTSTISVGSGSPVVTGASTNWEKSLVGMILRVGNEQTTYTILQVDSTTQLTLERAYIGQGGVRKPYTILDKTTYFILKVDSSNQLTLDRSYVGPDGPGKAYTIGPALWPHVPGSVAPQMHRQYPLDLVSLAALHPAVAQMLGLYWVDTSVDEQTAYDYLIVAAQERTLGTSAQAALQWIQHNGLDDVDAYIVFNQVKKPAPPLEPPSDLQVFALPMSDAAMGMVNSAGLRWDVRGTTDPLRLLPEEPVFYNVWRAALGNGAAPTTPSQYDTITRDTPLLITEPYHPPRQTFPLRPDWPPFRVLYIDRGVSDGWYSYQVSGIDVFGRHSRNSAAAPWYQWEPMPNPRPWYYGEPVGDRQVNIPGSTFAVRLLDDTPPPPPTGIEAYALDPADPTVLKDAAYNAWRAVNEGVVGLRVSWLWTQAEMRQAPDTREFRIYYQPGSMNALLGRTLTITVVSANECLVVADMPDAQAPDRYIGASLLMGADVFEIVSAPSTSQWSVRVRSRVIRDGKVSVEQGSATVKGTNTTWDVKLTGLIFTVAGEHVQYTILDVDLSGQQLTLNRPYAGPTGSGQDYTIVGKLPRPNTPCAIFIPTSYSAGTAELKQGARTVTGNRTNWTGAMAGGVFRVVGDPVEYRVDSVQSATALTLERDYAGSAASRKAYTIDYHHPLLVDYSQATSWRKRYHVVDYHQNASEVIRPARGADDKELRGTDATVAGNTISLVHAPDDPQHLARILASTAGSVFAPHIRLTNDSAGPNKMYRIVAVSQDGKTFTVDGTPRIGSSPSAWVIGWPVRRYEVFLPAPDTGTGQPFAPTLEDPIVYANISVSAADDKNYVLDNPAWNDATRGGSWGNRTGNEGRIGAPARIFRVLREPPPPPPIPLFDSDIVYATAADYHSRSFYTVRWVPAQGLHTHIFRALDDTLFQADWAWRKQQTPRFELSVSNSEHLQKYFPPELHKNDTATEARRNDIVVKINALNDIAATANLDDVRAKYRALTNDALRVLAGLPGSAAAFTQLTIQPLDPNDPTNANRVGPDNPPDFKADITLRAYVDTLDGRSTNRYFYRAAYVDGAHNRSKELSLSSPNRRTICRQVFVR